MQAELSCSFCLSSTFELHEAVKVQSSRAEAGVLLQEVKDSENPLQLASQFWLHTGPVMMMSKQFLGKNTATGLPGLAVCIDTKLHCGQPGILPPWPLL